MEGGTAYEKKRYMLQEGVDKTKKWLASKAKMRGEKKEWMDRSVDGWMNGWRV